MKLLSKVVVRPRSVKQAGNGVMDVKRFFITALIVFASFAYAQDMQTAEQFFGLVSEQYGQIVDYQCQVSITSAKMAQRGSLSFKTPSLLRIDFSQPSDQVICFNGDTLIVYIPEFRAILSQQVAPGTASGAAGAGMASGEGLKLLRKNYTIAFETSPAPVPLESGGSETVVRLVLARRTVAEGFRTIKISVNPSTKLIRRIEGTTLSGDVLTFDFIDIKTNQNIPVARFSYDLPAGANVYNDFLFKTED